MLLLLELSCEGGIGVGFCGVAGMDVAAGVWAVRIAGLVVPMYFADFQSGALL